MKEFLPHSVNSHMSINSGPCAAMNEVIKTPFIGCVKDGDMAFVFMSSFLENGMHAIVLGMINVFICQYKYKTANRIHDKIPYFPPFVITELFDDPFPKRVWDGIIVVQELCRSILSTYSAKQGNFFKTTKKQTFLQMFGSTLLTIDSKEKQGKQ